MSKKYGISTALSEDAINFIKEGLEQRGLIAKPGDKRLHHTQDAPVPEFKIVDNKRVLWIPPQSLPQHQEVSCANQQSASN